MRLVKSAVSAQPARRRGTVAVMLLLAVAVVVKSDSWFDVLGLEGRLGGDRRLEFRCVLKT